MKLGLILPPRATVPPPSVPQLRPLPDGVATWRPARASLELAELEARALFELMMTRGAW